MTEPTSTSHGAPEGEPGLDGDLGTRVVESTDPGRGARRRQVAWVLFVLFVSTYAYFQSSTQWNENSRFDLTRSLIERGRLDIDPYHINTEDKARFSGHYYSDKAPGASLLGTLGYGLFYGVRRLLGKALPRQWIRHPAGWRSPRTGRRMPFPAMGYNPAYRRGLAFANLTANVIPAALALALLFFVLVTRFHRSDQQALFAVFVYGLGSLAFPYATLFYGHQLAASLLITAWSLWELGRDERATRPAWHGILAGLLLAYAVATEYTVAPVAAFLGLWMLWGTPRRVRTFLRMTGGALPVAVALAFYHWACFGSPFSVGYQHLVDPVFAKGMSQGLLGLRSPDPRVAAALLLGPHRGLFFESPVFVLSLVGLWAWWRQGPRGFVALVAATFVYYWMLNASYYMWDGGAALGPRHMIPALGLLAAAVAWAYPEGPGKIARAARLTCFGSLAWSVANMLAATAVGPEAPMGTADPLTDFVWPHFLDGSLAYTQGSSNFGQLLGLPGLWSLLPLGLVWSLVALWFWRLVKNGRASA